MLTVFLRRQGSVSTGRNISLSTNCVDVGDKIRICAGKEKVPHYRGLWQLLLRIPLQSFTSGGQFLEREGQPSVSCSTLVPDRENRCLGSGDRALAALGVAVPWKGDCPAPFPAAWKQRILPSYTSGNLPKDRVLKAEKSGMGHPAILEAGRLRQRNDVNSRSACLKFRPA